MSTKAELERERLLAELEGMDQLPEQSQLYKNREAELSRSQYINKQGGIDAADRTFADAQETLHDALADKQQLQNAQQLIDDRKEFLRSRAVPHNTIENQRTFQNMAKDGATTNPLAHDHLPKGQNYAADHVVSFEKIWNMPGFQELSVVDQLSIIRDGANFQPLNKSLNSSKREHGYSDWKGLENGPDLSGDSVYQEVTRMESEITQHLQNRINEMSHNGNSKLAGDTYHNSLNKLVDIEATNLAAQENSGQENQSAKGGDKLVGTEAHSSSEGTNILQDSLEDAGDSAQAHLNEQDKLQDSQERDEQQEHENSHDELQEKEEKIEQEKTDSQELEEKKENEIKQDSHNTSEKEHNKTEENEHSKEQSPPTHQINR